MSDATVTLRVREARLALALAERMAERAKDGGTARECHRLANVLRLALDGVEDARRVSAREYAARRRASDPEGYAEHGREAARRYRAGKRAVA